ncbi:MAG: PDZ domain-containing protein [Acidobacteriia bacterium]|nr:PDZ domain-containing protein [Terriglobia bacterium]
MQIAVVSIALGAMAAAQARPAPAPAPVVKARPAVAAAAKPVRTSSYLGVDIRSVIPERVAALKLKEARGVEITLVDRDAPAGKAGLKEHDVILSFNGRNIQNSEELRKLIRETLPGQTVELGISRDGQPMTLKAELADRHKLAMEHSNTIVIPKIRIQIPEMDLSRIAVLQYQRRNGVMVENLTPQLGEAFGVKNGDGVMVRSVDQGSAGEAAGLRAGDVIVRIGNEPVADTSEWNRLMREQKAGPVPLGIVREKRQQTLSLTVPEAKHEQSFAIFGMGDSDWEDYKNEMLELHRVRPEVERALREAQEKMQRALERSRREFERSQRETERAQRDAQRAQREAERAQEQAQREAERAQERAQREQEKALPPEQAPEAPKPPTPPQ